MKKLVKIFLLLFVTGSFSCSNEGFNIDFLNVTNYDIPSSMKVTPKGIKYLIPGDVDPISFPLLLDILTDELEQCLQICLERSWFAVYVPSDWYVSVCSGLQLIPSIVDPELCRIKGLTIPVECEWLPKPTENCPCVCNVRAAVQDNYYIVSTPDLVLYKAELTSMIYNDRNPWDDDYRQCL